MIEVKFTVASAQDLQGCIARIHQMINGGTPGDGRKDATINSLDAPSLALYNDGELADELKRRQEGGKPADDTSTTAPGTDAPKRRPGRPQKLQAVAPPTPPATEEGAATEPPPDPAAVAAAKPTEPSQAAGTVTGNLPSVEQMLKLMTTVYSKCGDINLVRGIAEEVCGKVNLADCDPNKFPALKARLDAKLAELTGAAA
jgi:hypothetical protein